MFGFGKKKKLATAQLKIDQIDDFEEKALIEKNKRKKRDNTNGNEPEDPTLYINGTALDAIRDVLIQNNAPLIIRGMTDPEAREELTEIIRKEHRDATRGKEFLVQYIARETVGTGVIEDILSNDPTITDIGYNGTHLIVESNDNKYIYDTERGIDDTYIVRLVGKFANANNRDFTQKNPIFDGKFENIRVNAMYGSNTTSGVTMSLRIVRPQLALTKKSFYTFAPQYIYDLFEAIVKTKGNMVISGETGTGKTELQKMLASFVPFNQRVILIEDVAETFLKEMFADKDIYSWVTSPDVSITDLVKASLRNNPRWILVSETRGQEAYEMIQAVLSGHHIITTLHAINAGAIPTRLINMSKMGYTFDEHGLEADILRYFDFGVHIIRDVYKGKTLRYLNELVYFDEHENTTLFRQDFINGKFVCQINELPDTWYRKLKRTNSIPVEFEEHTAHSRIARVTESETETGIKQLTLTVKQGKPMTLEDIQALLPEEDVVMDRAKRDVGNTIATKSAAIEPFIPEPRMKKARPVEEDSPVIDLSRPRDQAFVQSSQSQPVQKSAKAVARDRLVDMKSKQARPVAKTNVKKTPVRTDQAIQDEAAALLAKYKPASKQPAKSPSGVK